jgi:hypothetical protein
VTIPIIRAFIHPQIWQVTQSKKSAKTFFILGIADAGKFRVCGDSLCAEIGCAIYSAYSGVLRVLYAVVANNLLIHVCIVYNAF